MGNCIIRSWQSCKSKHTWQERALQETELVPYAFTKGGHGGFYLIAGVGHLEGLKEIGVHSKTVPAFVLPDRYLHIRGADPGVERGLLQHGEADSRSKMQPDMMILEMTAAEQQTYIPHNDATRTTMSTLNAR